MFRALAEHGLAMVAPDTSPRGAGIAGETDSWDFGVGAGFYLDATEHPWSENYRMYTYITVELLDLIARNFPIVDVHRAGITGHSMGGHGALTIALKNQTMFRSVSAFAPICNPIQCAWGQKAFSGYLGSTAQEAWKMYDACALMERLGKSKYSDILIDVGTSDSFLTAGQLRPEKFLEACSAAKQPVTLRYQGGYDHSYYFVSTFVEDHVRFHAQFLNA
jgi:S-formylglutathione hydrolase